MESQVSTEGTKPVSEQSGGAEFQVSSALQLAQGVVCGDLRLAFTFRWARLIVEDFDLVALPRAPGWVLGAVNVNGSIVPVVDLISYFTQSVQPAQLQRGQRLLVGGIQAEDAEAALAIVFLQTPVQLEYKPQPLSGSSDVLMPRLLEVCSGLASDDQGNQYFEIDTERLMDVLSIELSLI